MQETWSPEQYQAFLASPKAKKKDNTKRGNKAKDNMHWVLVDVACRYGLTLTKEYRFNPERKWSADWALFGEKDGREIKLLIEYEGLGFGKTGHTDSKGYSKDTLKYNSAQALGWAVLRFTYLTCHTLEEEIKMHINITT